MKVNTNMHRRTFRREITLLVLMAFLLVNPVTLYSQNREQPNANASSSKRNAQSPAPVGADVVRAGELDRWMYSRIFWVGVLSAIGGFLLSWFYLSRLSYKGALETDLKARRFFLVTLVFIVLPVVLLLLYADMYFYWFIGYSPFTLLGGLFGLQGFLMAVSALLGFTLASTLTTKLKPASRCPYMLWPRPRVK